MEDFIIFSNTCGGKTAIRKSEIAVIHEGDDEDDVEQTTIWVGENQYGAVESFEDIMAKLDE